MSGWFSRLQPQIRRTVVMGTVGILAVVLLLGATLGREAARSSAPAATARGMKMMQPIRMPSAKMQSGPIAAESVAFEGQAQRAVSSVPGTAWPASPMLIRTATMQLQVKDVTRAYAEIAALAQRAGGYVAASTLAAESAGSGATITIRLPNQGLDNALERIAALGKLLSRDIQAQEVSEEYVDLGSRQRNLQREEVRLLELMQRAGRVSDLLSVEQEVARVRGEIETVTGRMRYLENRVALSTITVQLEGPHFNPAPTEPTGPVWQARSVAREAYASLRATGHALATLLIWIGMYLPVWLPLGLGVRWLVRREMRKPS